MVNHQPLYLLQSETVTLNDSITHSHHTLYRHRTQKQIWLRRWLLQELALHRERLQAFSPWVHLSLLRTQRSMLPTYNSNLARIRYNSSIKCGTAITKLRTKWVYITHHNSHPWERHPARTYTGLAGCEALRVFHEHAAEVFSASTQLN